MSNYTTELNYLLLDEPYEPLNQFILDEQAAGRLAKLERWDETRTLRKGIKAMRSHRLGAKKIGQYYSEHPKETADINVGSQIARYLDVSVVPKSKKFQNLLFWRPRTFGKKRQIVKNRSFIPELSLEPSQKMSHTAR